MTSDIYFPSLIFMLYTMFLTNELDSSCVYFAAAIRKIKVKQRFYDRGLNGVSIYCQRKPVNFYVNIYSQKQTQFPGKDRKSMSNLKKSNPKTPYPIHMVHVYCLFLETSTGSPVGSAFACRAQRYGFDPWPRKPAMLGI